MLSHYTSPMRLRKCCWCVRHSGSVALFQPIPVDDTDNPEYGRYDSDSRLTRPGEFLRIGPVSMVFTRANGWWGRLHVANIDIGLPFSHRSGDYPPIAERILCV